MEIIKKGQKLQLKNLLPAADSTIGCLIDIQVKGTPIHSHTLFYELVVVINGKAEHRLGNTVFPIGAGDLFLIPPNEKHGYVGVHDLEIYNVLFTEDLVNMISKDLSCFPCYRLLLSGNARELPLHLEEKDLLDLLEELRLMHTLTTHPVPGSRIRLLSLFLSLMFRISSKAHSTKEKLKPGNLNAVSKLLGELDKNFAEVWTIEKMASFCKMSESNFRHEFKRLTGSSPVRYLVDLRLGKSMLFLYTHQKSVTEIAYTVGFNDLNYFIRQFRKTYGVTPSGISRMNAEK